MSYYQKTEACVYRLIEQYLKHGNIIVALDYDDTLYLKGYGFNNSLLNILLELQNRKLITIILFSCREGEELEEALNTCRRLGLRINYINEQALDIYEGYRKIYYNILLDDKSGLGQSLDILESFLNYIEKR